MGFLRRLLGGSGGDKPYRDEHGLYYYVACGRCGAITRVRADKRHDLNRTDAGHEWHKTIIDTRCYRPNRIHVVLDGQFNIVSQKAEGGRFVDEAQYNAQMTAATEEEE